MSKQANSQTFMSLYSDGRVMGDEIDDFIDQWHEEMARPGVPHVPLFEFLGMTAEEYEVWMHDASVLPHIVRARMNHASLDAVMHEHLDDMRIAARADNGTAIEALGKWLERRRKR